MPGKILVIDDEPEIVVICRDYLHASGFEVITAADGMQGLAQARQHKPDLVILDLMLPGMDGLDVCRSLRHDGNIPIIMLTARIEEADRLVGLELGADDYITKPFSPRELVGRVKAVLRRTESTGISSQDVIDVDERLKIDLGRREVWVDKKLIKLRPTEYRLLYHLIQNAGWVLTYDQILSRVWGYEYRDEPHYVRLYINYLRQKLEQDPANPKYILTERGVGYRFVDYKRKSKT